MKKTAIYIILSGWMLTGCGTYSRYHRPDLSMENLYSTLPADADTTTLASLSWREMFTDPKLQSLIETGLDRNTDLNVARLRVEAAASALLTAKLSYLPSLGLNAEGNAGKHDEQRQRHIMQERQQAGNWTSSATSQLQNVVPLPPCKEAVITGKPYRLSLSPLLPTVTIPLPCSTRKWQ